MRDYNEILTNTDGELVYFKGHRFCTEEAAITWAELSTDERSRYAANTDAETAYNIYADPDLYNYFKK